MPKPYMPKTVKWSPAVANFNHNTQAPGTWGGPTTCHPKPHHAPRGQLRGGGGKRTNMY